jgi:hypothetical protein
LTNFSFQIGQRSKPRHLRYLIKADAERRPVRDVYDFVADSEILLVQ